MKKFGIILGVFFVIVAAVAYFDVIDRIKYKMDPFSLVNGSHYEDEVTKIIDVKTELDLADVNNKKPVLYEDSSNGKIYVDKMEKDGNNIKITINSIGVMNFDRSIFMIMDNSKVTFAFKDETLDISGGGRGFDHLENGNSYCFDFVDDKNIFENNKITINIEDVEIHSHKRK